MVIDRRGLLLRAAAAVAAACTPVARPPVVSSAPAETVTPSGVPVTPTVVPTVPPPDWSALGTMLGDRLVRPGAAEYDAARRLYNTRFDGVRPEGIARCASADDVRACVAFAARHRIPVALRSGGHSYTGASVGPGLVIDVGPMSDIKVDAETVTVGAGARLIDIYAALAPAGRGIAAGSCPTVGITGLTLGGGIGVLTRAWGLTCDALVRADVVTADGDVRTCDAQREPELFWALRGGGGSFGVVTSLTLRTTPVTAIALGFLTWPWSRAAEVIRGWQSWIAAAPDATWSNVHLNGRSGGAPTIRGQVLHLGPTSELNAQIDALSRRIGSAPATQSVGRFGYLNAMMLEAGCSSRTLAECHLHPEGELERETYVASSVVLDAPLSDAEIRVLVDGMSTLRETPGVGGGAAIFDALGGAAAKVAPDATAYPHRGALAVVQMLATWGASAPQATVDASTLWLRGYAGAARANTRAGAYLNYADADLPDPGRAYFGANYPRLQRVKSMYDPADLFASRQGVRPA